MGRTSKFSFPYPGRKRASNESKPATEAVMVTRRCPSKAQKILGTSGDLNIDSPVREDSSSWRSFLRRPPSSGMSVAISESTQDGDLSPALYHANWRRESNDYPGGRASSTLLGRQFQYEATTDTSSSRPQLRTEHSSSTLRSYYDRQNTPLSVSQQTSASSVRDLALRKGYPPIAPFPRSPLLQEDFLGLETTYFDGEISEKSPTSQSSKRKPARLDLTRLFQKPREGGEAQLGPEIPPRSTSVAMGQAYYTRPPSALSQQHPDARSPSRSSSRNGQQKPTKSEAKPKKPSSAIHQRKGSQSSSRKNRMQRLSDVYEDRESLPHQPRIPTSDVGNMTESTRRRRTSRIEHHQSDSSLRDSHTLRKPASEEYINWQDVRNSVGWPRCETKSVTSNASRRTSSSLISSSDLRNNSVLSISSDSDSDSDEEIPASNARDGNHNGGTSVDQSTILRSQSSHDVDDRPMEPTTTQGYISRTQPTTQDGNLLAIPLPPLVGPRISGPWNSTKSTKSPGTVSNRKDVASVTPANQARKPARTSAAGSKERQPAPARSSRLMAVTKQEEALLEALRQKRARMKETIIAEHEIKKSPARAPVRKAFRDSESSDGTIRESKHNETGHILLYLDTPVPFAREIDTAEPSPDLSDFLSFGSDDDEDTTPRTSWILSQERARADSVTSPESEARDSPKTPQSAARLSAVGGLENLSRDRGAEGKKGVTFLENDKSGSPDFLDEADVIWEA